MTDQEKEEMLRSYPYKLGYVGGAAKTAIKDFDRIVELLEFTISLPQIERDSVIKAAERAQLARQRLIDAVEVAAYGDSK